MEARPLRIALIQTQAENAGAQEISRLLSAGLEARGHEVRQIFFFRRTASFDGAANALFCSPARPSGVTGMVRFLARLGAILRTQKPDVAVTFQHFGNLIGAPMARLSGVRRIVANQNTAPNSLSWRIKALDAVYGLTGLYDRVVVNSKESEALFGAYPGPYSRRVRRIDHGFADKSTPISKARARTALDLPADVPLLGCVARLHPGKNIAAAIRLLAVNTDQHLALAGQGAGRQALGALADKIGAGKRVHFLGELPAERVGLVLAAIDCFVFPSISETFGLAAAEAAQAGVPVVANALPILREVLSVEGEPCALFVDADDPRAFAAATRRVFEDPDLAAALAARGRRLGARFPLDAMIGHYIDLIEALVRRP